LGFLGIRTSGEWPDPLKELDLLKAVRLHIRGFSEFGVPILSRSAIVSISNLVLSRLDPRSLELPLQTDVAGILQNLRNRYAVDVRIEDLGFLRGRIVLGKVVFSENRIYLHHSLTAEHPAFRFVAGHEIGHWLLHRWERIRDSRDASELEGSADCEDDVFKLLGPGRLKSMVDWLEFQANCFAAALVMPQRTFLRALEDGQRQLSIGKNLGDVWLNPDDQSWRDFHSIVGHLTGVFGVSKTAVTIRLKELHRLHVHSQCGEVLDALGRVGPWRSPAE